jgi:TPR repeat protein
MFDTGVGVEHDKDFAMRCYQRAWRREPNSVAANNIAILYREAGNNRAMFRWFERALSQGERDVLVDLAECYLKGLGVRRSVEQAIRCLSAALADDSLFEATRAKAEAMFAELRPKLIKAEPG